jgi:hypothetical protein
MAPSWRKQVNGEVCSWGLYHVWTVHLSLPFLAAIKWAAPPHPCRSTKVLCLSTKPEIMEPAEHSCKPQTPWVKVSLSSRSWFTQVFLTMAEQWLTHWLSFEHTTINSWSRSVVTKLELGQWPSTWKPSQGSVEKKVQKFDTRRTS